MYRFLPSHLQVKTEVSFGKNQDKKIYRSRKNQTWKPHIQNTHSRHKLLWNQAKIKARVEAEMSILQQLYTSRYRNHAVLTLFSTWREYVSVSDKVLWLGGAAVTGIELTSEEDEEEGSKDALLFGGGATLHACSWSSAVFLLRLKAGDSLPDNTVSWGKVTAGSLFSPTCCLGELCCFPILEWSEPHNPRICNASAATSKEFNSSWLTFTSPLYMKSTSAWTSQCFMSFMKIIGCWQGLWTRRFSKYVLHADNTTLWHLIICPSQASVISTKCSLVKRRGKTFCRFEL